MHIKLKDLNSRKSTKNILKSVKQSKGNIKCKINGKHSEVKEFAHMHSYFSSPCLGDILCESCVCFGPKNPILINARPKHLFYGSVCVVEKGCI